MTSKQKAAPRRPAAQKGTPTATKAVTARLEQENAALAAKLLAAEQRIALLERQRDEALNRIDWVIDSVKSLTEELRRPA